MVFLEKLRKFKVCGNRFTIVHTDIGKQYEPELDKISRYFNRITLKTDRLKFIFKALNRPGKQDKYSHISAIFHRMKISMQNCDAYRATKKLELKLFSLEKVANFVLKNNWTNHHGFS